MACTSVRKRPAPKPLESPEDIAALETALPRPEPPGLPEPPEPGGNPATDGVAAFVCPGWEPAAPAASEASMSRSTSAGMRARSAQKSASSGAGPDAGVDGKAERVPVAWVGWVPRGGSGRSRNLWGLAVSRVTIITTGRKPGLWAMIL